MVKGKTSSGFKFEVSKRIAEDWRFTVALADMDSSDASRKLAGSTNVVRLLLKDQEEAFYKHLEDEDGIVPAEKVWNEVKEILHEMGKPAKKS